MIRFRRPLCLALIGAAVLAGCSGCIEDAQRRDEAIMAKARGETEPQNRSQSGEAARPENECLTSFFTQSLHYTGEGMRYWYEEEGGFMEITGIPYDELDCKTCHVKSCDRCHAKTIHGDKKKFSEEVAKSMNTCMPCHGREGLTFKFDGAMDRMDVHIAAGMVCADCHYRSDVHGDGRPRKSMRHPKSIRITCEECHVNQEMASPAFNPNTESHGVHGDRLTCTACHMNNATACMNCHFDQFLESGERKGNFLPMKDWMLLVNYDGQVTAGGAMTLVYQNRPFLAYAPYFTHSITAEGRACEDCHDNAAVRRMADGKDVPVLDFQNGKVKPWEGVAPLIPERLKFVFLNRTDEGWTPIPGDPEPMVQFAAYGAPLTAEQFDKLAMPMAAQ